MVTSQAVLIAVGTDWDGRRQILAVDMANRESGSSWKDFLLALRRRGLNGVEFVVADDHAGLRSAIREVLPEAAVQRCYVHFLRNALDHLPRKADDDCLQELRWLYDRRNVEEARRDLAAWVAKITTRSAQLIGIFRDFRRSQLLYSLAGESRLILSVQRSRKRPETLTRRMLKTKRERELSEADFDWLGAMLARVAGGKVPNIEALDGFMTALVICPDRVPPDEYMPVLICGRTEDDDLDFESVEEAEQFHDVLTRYFDEISRVLRRGELRMPCMAESGEELPAGNDWANGFLAGSHLRHDLWSEIVNDEKRATALIPIWALAYEHDEDPSMRPYDGPVSPEQREKLIAGVIASVRRLYTMFREDGRARGSSNSIPGSSSLKVGRNDPCPCGSGKKFKACCARLAFH